MKKLTRKEFLKKTGAGIAAFGLLPGMAKGQATENKMKYRVLGNTGMRVSEICFGASRTRDEGLIRFALDRGINFLDTGRAYANGNNEKLVRKVIAGRRSDIIVQSKMYLEESELNFGGKGKRGAREIRDILSSRLEQSLEALGTDYIDIMLYHSAEVEELVFHPEVLKFYDEQKRSGAIRAHGFSSHDYELNILKRNNRDRSWDVIMHPFNFQGHLSIHYRDGRPAGTRRYLSGNLPWQLMAVPV
ncbi:MAG: aldo/keto reductase [Bacteroidales bacterium]